jgi:hypothetical protein
MYDDLMGLLGQGTCLFYLYNLGTLLSTGRCFLHKSNVHIAVGRRLF